MNERSVSIVLATGLLFSAAQADTVIKAVPDTLPGKGFGALSGFMAGITGGPVGALVGTGVGWLFGGKTQDITGLSGNAYRVKREDGSETVVRSPGSTWSPGDRVRIVAGRLVAEEGFREAADPQTAANQ